MDYLGGVYRVSQRRACQVARIPVSTFRYQSTQEPRTALRLRIREIAQVRIRYGYRKIRVAAEARRLECRQETSVSLVSGRRLNAALQAAKKKVCGGEQEGAAQSNCS